MFRILTRHSPVPEWLERITFTSDAVNPSAHVGCLSIVYQRGGSYHWRPIFGGGPLLVIHAIGGPTVTIKGQHPPGSDGPVLMNTAPLLEPGLLIVCVLIGIYLVTAA